MERVRFIRQEINRAVQEAEKGLGKVKRNKNFYHDYIYLPARLYQDLVDFEQTLHDMSVFKKQFEDTGDDKFLNDAQALLPQAKEQLEIIYRNRKTGDKEVKWKNWYNPEIRRPNNGFPTFQMLDQITLNLNTKS